MSQLVFSFSFFFTNRWLCKGRRCRQVGNAASDCLRPLVRRFLSIPQPIFRTRQTQKEKKNQKGKIQLISFGKEISIGVGVCVCLPPVTRYAGAKEENRQKRIWFHFCVYVHTILWRTRPQKSNIIIMTMKAEMLSLYSGLPSSLTSLTVYVYSSIYISTVKSAIDGVDIDVVRVCSAGKEVKEGGTERQSPPFSISQVTRRCMCVCIQRREHTDSMWAERFKRSKAKIVYIYISYIRNVVCVHFIRVRAGLSREALPGMHR